MTLDGAGGELWHATHATAKAHASMAAHAAKMAANAEAVPPMQLGHTVIPSSTRRENLQSNFASLKLMLTDEDMTRIAKLDRGKRLVDPAGLKPKWD